MELEQYAEDFRKQGLGVVAISYDPVSILKDFTERHGISFPLLSDRGSKIIQRFGILNTSTPPYSSSGTLVFGIPHPGTYLVNREGVVQSKYFETRQADRYTAPTILLREFGSDLGTRETVVQTDHLSLKYYSSRDVVRPGARITLVADVQLGPKLHVYAPAVKNYIPIQFALDETPYSVMFPAEYPASENTVLARHQGDRSGLSWNVPGDSRCPVEGSFGPEINPRRKPGDQDKRTAALPSLRR